MRTVYGLQFTVQPKDKQNGEECIEELKGIATNWINEKYKLSWSVTAIPPYDGSRIDPLTEHWIYSIHQKGNNSEIATLEWCHPDDNFNTVIWNTRCVFARDDNKIVTAISIRISSDAFILRPTNYKLGRPKLIKTIFNTFNCYFSNQPAQLIHTILTSSDVKDFVNNVLLSKDRCLPVILISPDSFSEQPVVSPPDLKDKLLGFAIVAALSDKQAAYSLTDSVGKAFSCFNGAVRLYWPGFSLSDSPFSHPLYLQESIKHHIQQGRLLRDHFFNLLSGISSFRTSELGQILSIKRKIELQSNAAIDDLRKKVQDGTIEYDQMLNELEQQLQINETLIEAKYELESEVDRLNVLLNQQQVNCAECHKSFFENFIKDEITPDKPETSQPTILSVSDAVRMAQHNFTKTILFLPTATESAKDSPFKNPESVYNLFKKLDQLQSKLKKDGSIGETFKTALGQVGFDYKPSISDTSKGKFKSEYMFFYGDKKILFDEHVTIGIGQNPQECISIHWIRDNSKKIVVIGYCGKHLKNTKA
jgi:hypothetical protein